MLDPPDAHRHGASAKKDLLSFHPRNRSDKHAIGTFFVATIVGIQWPAVIWLDSGFLEVCNVADGHPSNVGCDLSTNAALQQDHATQLDWFAGHCWNAAISAANDKRWRAAAALFASAAAYHSARQSPNTDQWTRLTVS
jgi:hypothetical protein